MAERDNNKNINKVSLSNGTVLMDTSGVTVTPAYLLGGYTALDKTGTLITGIYAEKVIVSDSVPTTYELDKTDNMYIKHYS